MKAYVKRILIAVAVVAFAAYPAHAARREKALTTQQIARECLPSIVSITVLDPKGAPAVQGSGFVIAPNLIATNIHVVDGAHAVTANFPNGRSEEVYGIAGIDVDRDICLLYANTTGIAALSLGSLDTVQIGDPVVALGCPEGLGASVSTGIISGVHNVKGSKIIQTTAPVSHGSSGGALVDGRGRVLGITSFVIQDGENLNFAYASYYLTRIMPRGPITYVSWNEMELYNAQNQAPASEQPKTAPSNTSSTPSTTPPASVADLPFTPTPLKGLAGVGVVVEDHQDDLDGLGVDVDAIQKDVEDRLTKAGITVLHSKDAHENDLMAVLFITGSVTKDPSDIYAYATYVALEEQVGLIRTPTDRSAGATWIRNDIDMATRDTIVGDIQAKIDKRIDEFIGDYTDQNAPAPATSK